MPTLADYIDLRAEVVRLLKTPAPVDHLDAHTTSAERWMGRNLRHRKQITTASVTFTEGRGPLPADFLEVLAVYNGAGWTYAQAPVDVVEKAAATGSFFAIDDADIIIPGVDGDLDVQYVAAIPTITGSLTGTNWLLAMHPELYAYAVAYEASQGHIPVDGTMLLMQMRDRLLDAARIENQRAQYGAGRVRQGGVVA
jgi:hypothetical protein